MATFTPPTVNDTPPVLPVGDPDQEPGAYRLFRHFRARPSGINVYQYRVGSGMQLAVGIISEVDPYSTYNADGSLASNGWDDLETVWWGGHDDVPITAAQSALLVAAGYTVTA